MMSRGFLGLYFFCLVAAAGATASPETRPGRRRPLRQTDALNKLYFDAARLRRQVAPRPAGGEASFDVDAVALETPETGSLQLESTKEGDKITSLPGQPQGVDFDQYGGYVTVNQEHGRALFYYFAEASDPSSKPLLLWLNGGPGCSSLGYGAMEELGPFRVMSDGKTLYRNPYSWNTVANVLFLESPAGVGFSYSNTTSDYNKSGDGQTAADAYVFLVTWMERFPEYKGREFYIAGESYAGHYVPQLASAILNHSAQQSIIHLKGIMIGNAVINDETDSRGMYDYFWTHALISDEASRAINTYCNFSQDSKEDSSDGVQCEKALNDVDISEVNIYNIYAPLCTSNGATTPTPKKPSITDFDPCTDNYVDAYLNRAEVQEALHAKNLGYRWSACSNVIGPWNDAPTTTLPLIKELMANNLRVLVYSGDVDGRVPITSTRYSLDQLSLPVKTKWNPWLANNEVGGYRVVYEGNLTLATVRGAGHEVPSYQALRALVLVKNFLEGK